MYKEQSINYNACLWFNTNDQQTFITKDEPKNHKDATTELHLLSRLGKQLSNKWVSWHVSTILIWHILIHYEIIRYHKTTNMMVGHYHSLKFDCTKLLVELGMWMLNRLVGNNEAWRQLIGLPSDDMTSLQVDIQQVDLSSLHIMINSQTNVTTFLIFHLIQFAETPSLSYLASIGRPRTLLA